MSYDYVTILLTSAGAQRISKAKKKEREQAVAQKPQKDKEGAQRRGSAYIEVGERRSGRPKKG